MLTPSDVLAALLANCEVSPKRYLGDLCATTGNINEERFEEIFKKFSKKNWISS